MPVFKPFKGIRFDTAKCEIGAVTAPPYDVIDAAGRAALVQRDPHNIVRVDLPAEADGPGRYRAAAELFDAWIADGTLTQDATDTFYFYRMDFIDDAGAKAHTLGVLGALELSRPGVGSILPHEHTTPKAKTDRLDLLRATRVNLSAIWGLSLSAGLTELCSVDDEPAERWTDDDGVTHTLWCVTDTQRCEQISDAVGRSPIVIADGHHRYETSLTYRDERRLADDHPEGSDAAMVFVVELSDHELTVRPIHRLVSGVDDQTLADRLALFFTRSEIPTVDDEIIASMSDQGALTWVHSDGSGTLLYPVDAAFAGDDNLDSSRLAEALSVFEDASVTYLHGVDNIRRALENGEAEHGFLLRPATVAQIRENAHSGSRMPPKTTFFHPKPRTGQVFRSTD